MNLTIENIEAEFDRMKAFYKKMIMQSADRHGGLEKLSLAIGYHRSALYKAIEADNFTRFRKIVALIMEKGL